jgi:hypothetical protein
MFGGSTTANVPTNTSGVATAPALMANSQSGSYTVTASVSGVGTPANFSLTNNAGSPASIVTTAGTSQSAIIGTTFATALQATVKDSGGNLVSGVTVTFTAPASGASGTFSGSGTANVLTNASGVATAPALTANSQPGGYTVAATVAGAANPANFSLTDTAAAASGGTLQGTETSATTTVNLTAEGALDWIHWGDFANAAANRKAGVSQQLSTFTVVGSGTLNTYNNDPRRVSWTDGTPTASSSNNAGGSYISGVGKGFSFTAPADTGSRTLLVHVGGYNSGGTLTGHLSDGSATDYVNIISAAIGGQYDRNYTISYSAASAGQTLTVQWVMSSGSGNVTLSAAALQGANVAITSTAGTPQGTYINTGFATALQATVKDSGGNPISGLSVTFTAPTSGASGTFGGSSTANVITNASGVATAPALMANNQTGGYTVTAMVAGLASVANFSLTNIIPVGSLQGTGTSATTAVSMTTEGTTDWIHWGETPLNRKAGGTPQLSSYTVVGTGTVINYFNDPRTVSWSNGQPTASSTSNRNGIYISGTGQGFSFTAPADTTLRTLVVHVGGYKSGGILTAHLSDGSASDFIDVTPLATGQFDRNYTLTYQATAAGTLTVTWKMNSGTSNGNVTLNAATLQ